MGDKKGTENKFLNNMNYGFKDLAKKTSDFFNKTRETIEKPFKQLKKERWEKKVAKAENCLEVRALKKQVKDTKKVLDKKLKEIQSDTAQIKGHTTQILCDTSQITAMLNLVIDKVDNIEEHISEIAPMLEKITVNIDNLEDFMREHLGSEWEKIKGAYQNFKDGAITRGELIGYGLKTIGKSFARIFLKINS
ncbi:MAG: hypothetical protein ACTSR8_13000 [Promethearchaeota archaeon]